jgi:hypothetical protein
MPNGDDEGAQRARLASLFTQVTQEELGNRLRKSNRLEEEPFNEGFERVTRLLTNLFAAAANNTVATSSDPDEGLESARQFARDVLLPAWGDWARLEKVIQDSARRCRYWPLCWS